MPPKLVNGSGTFNGKLSADGHSISWTLTWTGLTGPAQVAHIHFRQPQNTGTPVVFFCAGPTGPNARPHCPEGPNHFGSISGTWTAADVVAVPSQNVSAGDFAAFVKILRAHLGYANIHTPLVGGGEIRGQVSVRQGTKTKTIVSGSTALTWTPLRSRTLSDQPISWCCIDRLSWHRFSGVTIYQSGWAAYYVRPPQLRSFTEVRKKQSWLWTERSRSEECLQLSEAVGWSLCRRCNGRR